MRRRNGFGGVTCGESPIKTLLHQIVGKISDISHGRHPALFD